MPSNLAIDDSLLEMAKSISKHKTKKAGCSFSGILLLSKVKNFFSISRVFFYKI